MTHFPLPYPSWRCRGILWCLPRSAVAIVPSGFFANVLLVATFLFLTGLASGLTIALPLLAAIWLPTAVVIALVNTALTSIVTVRADGVRVRRVILAFMRVEPAVLGGTFHGVDMSPLAEEWDDGDDSLSSEVAYHSSNRSIAIDCFRPAALAQWLAAQAARIRAHHPLPTAIAIAPRRAPPVRGAAPRATGSSR